MPLIWVLMYLARKCLLGTLFLLLLLETGPPFYVVIRAMRGSSGLQCELIPSFLRYFKTLSNGPAPGIEPTTSRSAVKRSPCWANPTAVIQIPLHQSISLFLFHLRWPKPVYMRVGYVFRLEGFDRFLLFLASLIKNSRTLRNCYLFSCIKKRIKRFRYRHMSKTTFLQKMSITSKPCKLFRLGITLARDVCCLGIKKKKIWKSSYSFHYPQWQTARANLMANLTSLNKLPNTRVSVAAENGSVEVLKLVALFLVETGWPPVLKTGRRFP